jgi:hypothetical protein
VASVRVKRLYSRERKRPVPLYCLHEERFTTDQEGRISRHYAETSIDGVGKVFSQLCTKKRAKRREKGEDAFYTHLLSVNGR